MQYKIEIRRSFIVSMFFLFCAVAFFYSVQSVRALDFPALNATVAVGKCVKIDLTEHVADAISGTDLSWDTDSTTLEILDIDLSAEAVTNNII